jgi:hypothetical protein
MDPLELVGEIALEYPATLPAASIQQTRGSATIPLTGIDVPFHSSILRPWMPAFRRVLQGKDGSRPAETGDACGWLRAEFDRGSRSPSIVSMRRRCMALPVRRNSSNS